MTIDPHIAYVPSKDVVYREIEGEPIIVPLTSGLRNVEDDLFSLNETGKAIWAAMDGKATVTDIAANLAEEYDEPSDDLRPDVTAFLEELLKRGMITSAPGESAPG